MSSIQMCEFSERQYQKDYHGIYILLPSINNLILAQHPIVGYCKNNNKINNSTLLILVGGPMIHSRVFNHKIQKWISAIQKVIKLKNPSQIHLRLHPRESKNILKQFEQEFIFLSTSLIMVFYISLSLLF